MSGGCFDYAFAQVDHFVISLRHKVEDSDYNSLPAVAAKMEQIACAAEHIAALMREAEWFYSGDTDDESFLKRVRGIDERYVDE